jgi:hypothetical protein
LSISNNGEITPKKLGKTQIWAEYVDQKENKTAKSNIINFSVQPQNLSLTINSDAPTMFLHLDETVNITAVFKENGIDRSKELEIIQNVNYEYSDNDILTVDNNGKIVPVNYGNITLTAEFMFFGVAVKSNTINFEIVQENTELVLAASHPSMYLNLGEEISLSGILKVNDETSIENADLLKDLKYEISPEGIISIDMEGKLSPVGTGTAIITAAYDYYGREIKSNDVSFEVLDENVGLVLSASTNSMYLNLGEEASLQTALLVNETDKSGEFALLQYTSYEFSNPGIIAIGLDGEITPLAVGTTSISAKFDYHGREIVSNSIKFNVLLEDTNLKISIPVSSIYLNIFEPAQFGVVFTINETDVTLEQSVLKNMTFEFSTDGIISIDSTGFASPVAAGSTTVTGVYNYLGTEIRSNAVNFSVLPENVSLTVNSSGTSLFINYPQDVSFGAVLLINEIDKSVETGVLGKISYEYTNAGIISIDSAGKVSAIKTGTTGVTALYEHYGVTVRSNTINFDVQLESINLTLTSTASSLFEHSGDIINFSSSILVNGEDKSAALNLNQNLVYEFSNNGVISIDSSGKVIPLTTGTTNINTLYNYYGNEIRSNVVSFSVLLENVSLSLESNASNAVYGTDATVLFSKQLLINNVIQPDLLEDSSLQYYTYEPSGIIDIDDKGNTSILGAGTTIVTGIYTFHNRIIKSNFVTFEVLEEIGAIPPYIKTIQGKAGENSLTILFSEPVYGGIEQENIKLSQLNYFDSNSLGGIGISSMIESDGSDGEITLEILGNFLHMVDGNGVSGDTLQCIGVLDAFGNQITNDIIVIDVKYDLLKLITAETKDFNGNGFVDHYKLTFNGKVADESFPGFVDNVHLGNLTNDWLVANQPVQIDPTIVEDNANDNVIYIKTNDIYYSNETPQLETSINPRLHGLGSLIFTEPINENTILEKDSSAPVILSAKAVNDDNILLVEFSEPVTGQGNLIESTSIFYIDINNGGALGINAVEDYDGSDKILSFRTNGTFEFADENSDKVSISSNKVIDYAGNEGKPANISIKMSPIQHVALDEGSVCAISITGKVKCWGRNITSSNSLSSVGLLGLENNIPPGDTDCNYDYKIDNADCWGDDPGEMGDNLPEINLGSNRTAKKISMSFGTTCTIMDDNSLKCWGSNDYGKLGIGLPTYETIGDESGEMGNNLQSIDLGGGVYAIDVKIGRYNVCALLNDFTVKCWGYHGVGQLGLGNKLPNGDSNCQYLNGQPIKCWGDDPGEMGDNLPRLNLGTDLKVKSITVGEMTSCAIMQNRKVKCWGGSSAYSANGLGDYIPYGKTDYNDDGTIDSKDVWGDDDEEMGDNLPYIDLGEGRTALKISTYGGITCVLLDNHNIKCWGSNHNGGLGIVNLEYWDSRWGDASGEMGNNLPEINLGVGRTAIDVVAGTCAILDNLAAKCWGWDFYGRLGFMASNPYNVEGYGLFLGEMGDDLLEMSLGSNLKVKQIIPGGCALFTNGKIKCWGATLGLGDFTPPG